MLVDEYQDTNHAQYVLVRELDAAGRPGVEPAELCVVGDADQSIYAFRGATIRNILDFEEDYPDADDDPARAELPVDADDPQRRQRGHRAQPQAASRSGCGPMPTTAEPLSATSPTTSTTRPRSSRARSTPCTTPGPSCPSDVAVFYRTNAQSRVFEEVFIRVGLPYRVVGGVRFYERKEVRDALAYLRLLANPDDTVSLRRILNTPRRGIGDRAEACLVALVRARAHPLRRSASTGPTRHRASTRARSRRSRASGR